MNESPYQDLKAERKRIISRGKKGCFQQKAAF